MEIRERSLFRTCLALGVLTLAHVGDAAEIVVKPSGIAWKVFKGDVPQPNPTPELVIPVNKGDEILFDLSANARHGFSTIDKKGNDNPSSLPGAVWSCAQAASPTGAVLHEVECNGTSTIFDPKADSGAGAQGKIKLQVLDNFSDDIHFWCTVHQEDMWGTLHLSQK